MLGYKELNDIYTQINHHSVINTFVTIAKGFCVAFVMVQLIRKFMKSAGDASKKMKPYDFIRPIIIVVLIASYNYIMTGLDYAGSFVDGQLTTYFEDPKNYDQSKELTQLEEKLTPDSEANGEKGIISKIGSFIDKMSSHIILFVYDILSALGELVNSVTYTVALVIRFAMLFFLRVIGPIALLASIMEGYEKSFFNWLRTYAFYYLWLYAIFIINLFFNLFYQYSAKAFTVSGDATDVGYASGCMILAAIIAKIVLYKKSYNILSEVITGT